MTHGKLIIGSLALMLAVASVPAFAQSGNGSRVGPRVESSQSATTADIQRLQNDITEVSTELAKVRSANPQLASQLQPQFDELRDEVIYLRVKLRKEGTVSRSEYLDVRDRIDNLRVRARGDQPTSPTTAHSMETPPPARSDERRAPTTSAIPVGTEIDVRLQTQLSSETAQVEDRFEATTVVDLYRGEQLLIPAGSLLRGIVRTVNKASRTDRAGEITVSFDQIAVGGRNYPMRGTVTDTIKSEGVKGEIGKIGAGSAIGGVIGGLIGGVKGAIIGVLVGGTGTIAATPGKDVTLPPGTVLRVRLDTPPDVK